MGNPNPYYNVTPIVRQGMALNPVIVTSASATPITTDTVTINKIRWVGASAAGDSVVVEDSAGNVKFASVATGANYVESETFDNQIISVGLKVTTLTSGTVYIYLES